MSEQRVLPADVYDTLALSALAFHGIGGAAWFEDIAEVVPVCISGHATFVCNGTWYSPVRTAMTAVGLDIGANDDAVFAINKRKQSLTSSARVSWKEYTRELNIVRGD